MIEVSTVIEEVASEAAKLYSDYNITIFQAIEIATKIMKEAYKDIEIVEGD